MSSKKSKTKYFFTPLFILYFLVFLSSETFAATVMGTISCDAYTSGNIVVYAIDATINQLSEITQNDIGTYSLSIDDEHLGELIAVRAYWDKNGDVTYDVGEYWGRYEGGEIGFFILEEENNNIDININREITTTVSGEVTCDAFTEGNMSITIWDGPIPVTSEVVSLCNVLSMPNSYNCFILDIPIGDPVWVKGTWDKDGSGLLSFNFGDYYGWYIGNPLTLGEDGENTEINVDISHEYVANISGEVTCAPYTSGYIYISILDGPDRNTANEILNFGNTKLPPGSYITQIYDISIGDQLWVLGYWDKDNSGSYSPFDYEGAYAGNPIIIDEENVYTEINGIDFDACTNVVCPLTIALKERPKELSILRQFRDNILRGSDYVPLYYQFADEISSILLSDARIETSIGEMVEEYKSQIESLVGGEKVIFSRKEMEEIENLLDEISSKASPELKITIKKVKRDIESNKILKDLGIIISN